MSALPIPTAPVPSPCINICQMHPATGLCEGCQRTIDEIATWSTMGEAQKQQVWSLIERRREAQCDKPPAA